MNNIFMLAESALGDDDATESVKKNILQLVVRGNEKKNLERSKAGFERMLDRLKLEGKTKLDGNKLYVQISGVDSNKWVNVVKFIEADSGVNIAKNNQGNEFRIPFSDMYISVGYNSSKKLFGDEVLSENMNDYHGGSSVGLKPEELAPKSRKEFLVDGEPVQADTEDQALRIAIKKGAKEVVFKWDGKVKGEWTWNEEENAFERDVSGQWGNRPDERTEGCKTEGLSQVFVDGVLTEGADQTIECWDNGGETADRYTVVFLGQPEGKGMFACIGASEAEGAFYQHSTCQNGKHLGKLIRFSELPKWVQKKVETELDELDEGLNEGAYGDYSKMKTGNPTDISYWFEHSIEPIMYITKKLVFEAPEADKSIVEQANKKLADDELEDVEAWYKQCDKDDKADIAKALRFFKGKSFQERLAGCIDMISDSNYHSMARLLLSMEQKSE